jgi:hypothetical protein
VRKWDAHFAFHFSIPCFELVLPRLWSWRPVAKRRVWPAGIVVQSPAFSQYSHLLHRVEDLSVQELVLQLRVEGLAVSVLPWTAGFDVQCSDPVAAIHLRRSLATNSGPLSEQICPAAPFITMMSASASITLVDRRFLARLSQRPPVRYRNLNLPKQVNDLLRYMLLSSSHKQLLSIPVVSFSIGTEEVG